MSWKDLACLGAIIFGLVLFLYGSNYYTAAVGWTGVCLIIVGFFAEIVLQVYEALMKRGH
jgi:heme O synthase-like polyprenyltransferase